MNAAASSMTGSTAGFALLFEEIVEKLQMNEAVDVEAIVLQYPEHAERLRRLLPAAGMLAELGRSAARQESPGIPVEALPGPEFGVLGDFRIVREAGRGGMGVVYEAVQISLNRRVALKVLPFAGVLDPRQLQRFQNEAQAAACLHHTGIVPVYAVGSDRGVHFYAMQYIEGQPLDEVIRDLRQRHGRHKDGSKSLEKPDAKPTTASSQPPAADPSSSARTTSPVQAGLSTVRSITNRDYFEKLARLGIQAADALDYAHQQGIIHRDIKPANLILDARGNVWITDFGLAHFQSQAGPTMTGELVGTLRYMSPEQAHGKRTVIDPRTDVYSMGATLYELLTLQPVFAGTDRQELLRQIASEEPLPPRRMEKAIPAELETIALKALEKNPADRYATAQELAGDMRNWLQDRPIQGRRPTLRRRLSRWASRHKSMLTAALVVLLLAVPALTATTLWSLRAQEQQDLAIKQQDLAILSKVKALEDRDLVLRQHEVTLGELRKSLATAEEQKQQLESQLIAVLSALRILADGTKGVPQREGLLKAFVEFYEEFAAQKSSNRIIRHEQQAAFMRIAEISTALGDKAKAEASYRKAVAISQGLKADFPEDQDFQINVPGDMQRLAMFLFHEGQEREAIELARRSLALSEQLYRDFPNIAKYRTWPFSSLLALSGFLVRCADPILRDPPAAMELAQRAVELVPTDQMAWRALGLAQYRAGEWKSAKASLEKHIQLYFGKGTTECWFVLAMVHAKLSEKLEARRCYDQGVQLAEQYPAKEGSTPAREIAGFRAEAAALLGIVDLPKSR